MCSLMPKRCGLVVSGWNMDSVTGYDFLREVRGDPVLKQTPFILMTAESKMETRMTITSDKAVAVAAVLHTPA